MAAVNKYGVAAVEAANLCRNKPELSPVEAWDAAVAKHFPNSSSSQTKCCPRDTFLGLCEEGYVKGVKRGNYTRSRKNKQYALDALSALQSSSNPMDAPSLWRQILRGATKQHNSQMHVVIALFKERLLAPETLKATKLLAKSEI